MIDDSLIELVDRGAVTVNNAVLCVVAVPALGCGRDVDDRALSDPDAYVRVEDFADALAQADNWEIETHERRTRPPGSATAAIHVEDVILRARRHRNG